MSHFLLLYIGDRDKLEQQMAPYDEQLEVVEVTDDGEPYKWNPQGKWDYYRIGGRWSGALKPKPGCSGLWPKHLWDSPDDEGTGFDSLRKGEVDWDAMGEDWHPFAVLAEGCFRVRCDYSQESNTYDAQKAAFAKWWRMFFDGLSDDAQLTVVDYHS